MGTFLSITLGNVGLLFVIFLSGGLFVLAFVCSGCGVFSVATAGTVTAAACSFRRRLSVFLPVKLPVPPSTLERE